MANETTGQTNVLTYEGLTSYNSKIKRYVVDGDDDVRDSSVQNVNFITYSEIDVICGNTTGSTTP